MEDMGEREEVVDTAALEAKTTRPSDKHRSRIQVSKDKKPLNFFVNLAKKLLIHEDEVELSGLGMAVTTTVTIAGILENSGHVQIKKVETALADVNEEEGRKPIAKAKIKVWIVKSDKFYELMKEEELKREQNRATGEGSSQHQSRRTSTRPDE